MSPEVIVSEIKSGNRTALAKAISLLENGGKPAHQLIQAIPMNVGFCYTLGITGAPGVGKSTLINSFIKILRQHQHKVGVIATDPTSPFSGGAILGDRIRMLDHTGDKGVFIRSLGSRGNPDGLSTSIPYILQLLHLYGIDFCLLETVGSGQLDVMIKAFANTTFLLISPEGGDEIQMMKAGILEIADIMIINKCDRKGAEFIETQLQTWLDLLPKERTWKPPILKVQANRDIGLEELYAAMLKHRTHIENGNLSSREIEHRKLMVLSLAVAMFRGHCEELLDSESTNQALGTIIQKLKEPSFNAVANATNLLTMFRDSTKL